jgi:hypothetical protein
MTSAEMLKNRATRIGWMACVNSILMAAVFNGPMHFRRAISLLPLAMPALPATAAARETSDTPGGEPARVHPAFGEGKLPAILAPMERDVVRQ